MKAKSCIQWVQGKVSAREKGLGELLTQLEAAASENFLNDSEILSGGTDKI